MVTFDCSDATARARGLQAAAAAARRGDLVLLPTESAYAVGTDAFSSRGVEALRLAKGQGSHLPLPVLVPSAATVAGIALVTAAARDLMTGCWPGQLTLLLRPQPTLAWDLLAGLPVAVRMPLHPVALGLLERTGPLVATAANAVGQPSPWHVSEAVDQLGDVFAVCLDGGPLDSEAEPSTVVDATGDVPVVRRPGAVPLAIIQQVCPAARDAADAG